MSGKQGIDLWSWVATVGSGSGDIKGIEVELTVGSSIGSSVGRSIGSTGGRRSGSIGGSLIGENG